MQPLSNFIFKKQYFTLKYINILTNYPILLFLKYDSNSTKLVNMLRIHCINVKIKLFLINSKYINKFIFKNKFINSISWLKNDIILIPFCNLEILLSFLSNDENISKYFHHLKIIGLSVHNYLINLSNYKDLLIHKNSNYIMNFYELINLYNLLLINLLFSLLNLFIYYFEKFVVFLNKPLIAK